MIKKILLFLIVSFLSIVLLAGLFTPVLAIIQNYSLYLVFHHLLGFTCHQIVERSFYISGFPMGVCCRCTGLYLGIIFTLVLFANKNSCFRWAMIIFSIMLGLLEKTVEAFGIYAGNNLLRFTSGILLGVGTALMIINFSIYIEQFLKKRKENRKSEKLF